MMQKVGNRYSLLNMLNGNLTIGLTDKMQNSDAEYYLQASALKYVIREWLIYARWVIGNKTILINGHPSAKRK